MKGTGIVRTNEALTAMFAVTSVSAVIFFDQPWKVIAVAVSLICFSVGVVAFLWGYWNAVQRSRRDNIAVASLYFLADKCAPKSVSVRMNSLLVAQAVIGLTTALLRSSTDGKAGSTLAFGILVPVLGIGLNGLWGAQNGEFPPRATGKIVEVPPEGAGNGQD
jgi:hypothetical protein